MWSIIEIGVIITFEKMEKKKVKIFYRNDSFSCFRHRLSHTHKLTSQKKKKNSLEIKKERKNPCLVR